MRDKDRHTPSSTTFTTATRRSQPHKPAPEKAWPKPRPRPEGASSPACRAKRPEPGRKRPHCPHRANHSRSQSPRCAHSSRWRSVTPCTLNGQTAQKYRGCLGPQLKEQPKQFVSFGSKKKRRLATPGQHGNLQLKIAWQALPEWGKKAETSNLELLDNRPFPECPVQLRTPANQSTTGHRLEG